MRPHQPDGPAPSDPSAYLAHRPAIGCRTTRHGSRRAGRTLLAALGLNLALLAAIPVAPAAAQDRGTAPAAGWSASPTVPERIKQLVSEAHSAYSQGELQTALTLQQQALKWANSHLPERDAFRLATINSLGVYLNALGRTTEALKITLKAVESLSGINGSGGILKELLAGLQLNLSNYYGGLSKYEQALFYAKAAVSSYQELMRSQPGYVYEWSLALGNLSASYAHLGQPDAALRPSETAVSVLGWLSGKDPRYKPELATQLSNLGMRYSELGQRGKALEASLEAVEIRRALPGSSPAQQSDLAFALIRIAACYRESGQLNKALDAMLDAINIIRELPRSNPSRLPYLASGLSELGHIYKESGQHEKSLEATREATEIRRELSRNNPSQLAWLANVLTSLGVIYSELGRISEAAPPSIEAVDILRRLQARDPSLRSLVARALPPALANLGVRYAEQRLNSQALETSQEAVAMQQELTRRQPNLAHKLTLADALSNLAIRYSEQGSKQAALKTAHHAIDILSQLESGDPSVQYRLAMFLSNLGNFQSAVSEHDKALASTAEAVQIIEKLAQSNLGMRASLAIAVNNLGVRSIELSRWEDARTALEKAESIYIQLAANNPARFKQELQRTRNNLFVLRQRQGLTDGTQIAADDLSHLNPNDPDTPLRRSVVRLLPTFAARSSGSGPILSSGLSPISGTGFVVRRQGQRAWIATARHVVLDPNTHALPSELKAEIYSGPLPLPNALQPAKLTVIPPSIKDSGTPAVEDDLILLEVKGLPADIGPLQILMEPPPPGQLRIVGHPINSQAWSVLSLPMIRWSLNELFLEGGLANGASGSPVVTADGRVVGIVTQTEEVGQTGSLVLTSALGSRVIAESLNRLGASP